MKLEDVLKLTREQLASLTEEQKIEVFNILKQEIERIGAKK